MLRPVVTLAMTAMAMVVASNNYAHKSSKTVIIQLFEWNWDSIAAECIDFIGPAGYGYVQVSPPSEHINGSQWWTDYQPVSYKLISKRGNRAQFRNMVITCKAAGVGVIADTIFNHMAGIESGIGVGGSSFTHYNYPGVYDTQNFHHCGLEPNDDIANYNNRLEVQTCELVNLADLATDTKYVQRRLAAYANDLIWIGVEGLRLDAAKHIAASDIADILVQLHSKPYITQEVIYGAGEPILPSEYTGNGDVQEFRYTSRIQNAFLGEGISNLNGLENLGWIPATGANVFVSNHDTERNGASLTYKSGYIYTLAHVFMMAYPYGTPTVLSSYEFSDKDIGAPNNNAGSCSGFGGTNGWKCQHRWTAIAGMVKWRNGVSGTVNNWATGSNQQIAFGRGRSGYVVVNNANSAWTSTFNTPLPAGSYCDMVSGSASGGKCTGYSFTVSAGSFTTTVPPRSAIAIFTGAIGVGHGDNGGSGGLVDVIFTVNSTVTSGENIFVVGNIAELGAWAPENSTAMSSESYPLWSVSVQMLADAEFSYKYIKKNSSGSVVWESDPNRSSTAPTSGNMTLNDAWR